MRDVCEIKHADKRGEQCQPAPERQWQDTICNCLEVHTSTATVRVTNDKNSVRAHNGFSKRVMQEKGGLWVREWREQGEKQGRTMFDARKPNGKCEYQEHTVIVWMDLAICVHTHMSTPQNVKFHNERRHAYLAILW